MSIVIILWFPVVYFPIAGRDLAGYLPVATYWQRATEISPAYTAADRSVVVALIQPLVASIPTYHALTGSCFTCGTCVNVVHKPEFHPDYQNDWDCVPVLFTVA